jgi:hypothetical protein
MCVSAKCARDKMQDVFLKVVFSNLPQLLNFTGVDDLQAALVGFNPQRPVLLDSVGDTREFFAE